MKGQCVKEVEKALGYAPLLHGSADQVWTLIKAFEPKSEKAFDQKLVCPRVQKCRSYGKKDKAGEREGRRRGGKDKGEKRQGLTLPTREFSSYFPTSSHTFWGPLVSELPRLCGNQPVWAMLKSFIAWCRLRWAGICWPCCLGNPHF